MLNATLKDLWINDTVTDGERVMYLLMRTNYIAIGENVQQTIMAGIEDYAGQLLSIMSNETAMSDYLKSAMFQVKHNFVSS